jgi:putative endonuclease
MAEHNELGKLGEEMAVEFLRKEIYTIYKTTLFRKQKLIFLPKEKTLAVVEVKTRLL